MEQDLNIQIKLLDNENNKIRSTYLLNNNENVQCNCLKEGILKCLNELFVKKLGNNKTNKVLNSINDDILTHLSIIHDFDNGQIISKMLNEVSLLSYKRISDLLICIKNLEITDQENIKVLCQVSNLLKGKDCLLRASKIQDNYIKEIINNRPHFDFKTKVKCILNASKDSEGTHVIKFGNLFLNTQKDGYISLSSNAGGGESRTLGLFTGDMQFINQYEFKIIDKNFQILPLNIRSTENKGFCSIDNLCFGDNNCSTRKRIINGSFFEKIELLSKESIKADIIIAGLIKDIFEVRGMLSDTHKKALIFCCEDNGITIKKEFNSGDTYGIEVIIKQDGKLISPISVNEDICQLVYQLDIKEDCPTVIDVKIQPLLNNCPYIDGQQTTNPPNTYEEALNIIKMSRKTEFAKIYVESDIPNIQKTLDKCIADLNMLVSYINLNGNTYAYIDAGLPRYSALFGRDSIITALGLLPLNPEIAKDTLELLALLQGKSFEERYKTELQSIRTSKWNEASKNATIGGLKSFYLQKEESPGKILHEFRVGEFAKNGMVPHSPYYGSVDATPLWLILYAEYFKWSQDEIFLKKFLPNAEAAIEWIDANLIDDYLRFSAAFYSKVKIQNQGWKDSGDSIKHVLNPKGFLSDPEYPIALAEVQGYAYKSYILMTEIYNILGKKEKAEILTLKAKYLKEKFNKDFWLESEKFYSMALDKNNIPVNNVSSNIGHCLYMGIIDDKNISAVENKLISPEMFSGWGIRTLSTNCNAFDPISYHNGSVWVHDTAFAAMGLSQENKSKITKALFEASNMFEDNRLPELFGGFQRKLQDTYIQEYAEACSPQAWASASVLWLLLSLIGLKHNDNRLEIKETNLPDWIKNISIS